MRARLNNELSVIALLVVVLAAAIYLVPANPLRVILGLPFVLFFPGYTLIAALFPRREHLGSIARISLGLGISIAIIPILGVVLNFFPWGISLDSTLWATTVFIFVTGGIALFRRERLPAAERFQAELDPAFFNRLGWWQNKTARIILICCVVAAVAMTGYAVAYPKKGQSFTEFYVLDLNGTTTEYPYSLIVGEEGRVVVHIVNHEHTNRSYRLDVQIADAVSTEIDGLSLEHGEAWSQEIGFTPQQAGENQMVQFLLYADGATEPYMRPLYLRFDAMALP